MGQDLRLWESSFARERGVSKHRHDDVLTLDGNFSAVGKIFSLSAFARSHRSSLSFREVRILRRRRRRKRIFPEEERSEICAGSSFSHHLCLPLFIIFFRHCALIFLLPLRFFFPARSFFSCSIHFPADVFLSNLFFSFHFLIVALTKTERLLCLN